MKQLLSILTLVGASFAPSSAIAPPPEPAIERPVTMVVIGKDLRALCGDLTRKTGVRLRVADDIADEKLDVFVRSRPLRSLMADVANLFGYKWSSPDSGKSFLLRRDAARKKQQEGAGEAPWKEARATAEQRLSRIAELLGMSEADVAGLPESQREFADYVRADSFRGPFSILSALSSPQVDRLAASGSISMPADALPPEVYRGLMGSFRKQPVGSDEYLEASRVDVRSNGHGPAGIRDSLWVALRFVDGTETAQLVGLSPVTMRFEPQPLPRPSGADVTPGFAVSASVSAWDTDARLDAVIPQIDKSDATYHQALQRIAEAVGVPVISDYFTEIPSTIPFPRQRARTALNSVLTLWPRLTQTRNGTILLRNPDWPDLMTREIPNSVLKTLESRGGKGTLNLAQSLIAAELTPLQQQTLDILGYRVPWQGRTVGMETVRLLGALGYRTGGSIPASRGISPLTLPEEGRAALERLMTEEAGGATSPYRVQRLTLSCESTAKSSKVRLSLDLVSDTVVTTRVYDVAFGPDAASPAN